MVNHFRGLLQLYQDASVYHAVGQVVRYGILVVGYVGYPVVTAYVVSKYRFKGQKIIYTVAIIVMLIPIVGSLPSQVRFAEIFNFRNNIVGVCIMNCKYPGLYFLVFYAAFKNVSWTYSEAAQIDGAGHFKIFIQIMLPMILSTISAVFILYFISFWNEYTLPMIFLPDYPTVSYGLYYFFHNFSFNL